MMNNYTNEKYPLPDITGKIIKCAIEVHKHLGNGFQEASKPLKIKPSLFLN